MAYKKFDEATKTVEQAPRKVYNAFPQEAIRRALQSVLNRVYDGDFGTAGTTAAARATALKTNLGTKGGASMAVIGGPNAVIINGRAGTRASCGTTTLPAGTQGTNCYVKYLVYGAFGSSGAIVAGNESATSTGAYLPDLPDGNVALGYFEWLTPAAKTFNRDANSVVGATTAGTATWVELVHMPLHET